MNIRIEEYKNIFVQNPRKIAEIAQKIISCCDESDVKKEKFYCFCLNAKLEIIRIELVSIGCLTSGVAHPREVFRPAILSSAFAIACVHTHPSGYTNPSEGDIELTRRLVQASEILGIEFLDHIIITEENSDFTVIEVINS